MLDPRLELRDQFFAQPRNGRQHRLCVCVLGIKMRADFRQQNLRLPHDFLPVGITQPVIGIIYRPAMAFDEMFFTGSTRGGRKGGHGGHLLKARVDTPNRSQSEAAIDISSGHEIWLLAPKRKHKRVSS